MKSFFLVVAIITYVFTLQAQIPPSLTKKFGELKQVSSNLFVFTKNDKQGLVNAQGVVICKPVFSTIYNSVNDLLTVSNDTLWGIATIQGKMVLPYNFEEILIFGPNKFGVYKNGVSFLINRENKYTGDLPEKVYTPPTYIIVKGKTFTPPVIMRDEEVPPSQENLREPDALNQKKIYVIRDGDTTIINSDEIDWLVEDQILKYRTGNLWGIANFNSINIFTPNFTSIELYDNESRYLIAKKGDKYGLMSFEGEELLPFEYYDISYLDNNELIMVQKRESGSYYFGLLNRYLEFVLPIQKNYIKSSGYLYDIDGKGYFDKYMKPVIPDGFRMHQYSNGEFAITNGKKGGIVNEAGYFIIPPIYDLATDATGDDEEPGLYEVILNGKSGVVNRKNKIVVPLIYDDIKLFYSGISVAVSKGKEGVIDKTGKVIIPFIYNKVSFQPDENNLYTVQRNELYGLINKFGKTIVPEEYEYITDEPEGGLYIAKKNGKFGFLDPTGKTVIPFIYDLVHPFYSETAEVQKDGEKIRINKKGERAKN